MPFSRVIRQELIVEFDFSQHTKVPAADFKSKVPADFHGLYRADGDAMVLDSENPGVKSAISAISGLNTALKASRAEAKNRTASVDLTPLKDFGDTPENIRAKVEETVKGLQEQIKGVNIDKIKADLAKQYSGDVEKANKRAEALQGQLYRTMVVGAATQAIAEAKGDVELLMPFVQQQVKTIEKDGALSVVVVDGAGDVRYSGVTGGPMSIKELIAEMKANTRYGRLFASESPAGAGAPPGGAARKTTITRPADEMSPVEKISAGLKKRQYSREPH